MILKRTSNVTAEPVACKANYPRLRALISCLCLVSAPGAAAWFGAFFSHETQTARTEIYRGVFYESYRLSNGMVHLVEIDLSRPGVELFLTPMNAEAVATGHQYRLEYVRNVARSEGLAVAINGTLFQSDSYLIPMVGDYARSVDTLVSDYHVSHLHPRDFMVWFEENLKPHVETSRPTPLIALEKARWAVGGQGLAIRDVRPAKPGPRDKQTLLGVDLDSRRVWFGVFESATGIEATEVVMNAGAQYVMMLDGGDSSSLYLGGRARGVPGGLRFGGQRPVATVIGVKADPILDPL